MNVTEMEKFKMTLVELGYDYDEITTSEYEIAKAVWFAFTGKDVEKE